MAVYTPEQLGIKAPSGGFATGGWYSGRQFWGGTLSDSGVIHPQSNQPGAGQTVSPQVASLTPSQQAAQKPTSKEQVTPYLEQYQQGLYNQANTPETKSLSEQALTALTTTQAPAPISRIETREALRGQYGVADLENKLTDLTAQEDEVVARLRQRTSLEEGKQVPMGVISGRITEVERQERENLDFVQRQKARVVDQ